jgi:hypothetical protein
MPKSTLAIALLVPLGLAARVAPAVARPAGPPSTVAPECGCRDVSGTYTGTWGDTTLQQQGTHVTGTYAFDDGRIDGERDGDTLRFTWTESQGSGRGVFQLLPDGSMQGTWGQGDSATSGGAWVLTPSTSGITSVGPKDGAWTWGLRIPWDAQFTPHNISMGVIGVTLDVGKHLASSRWYLGGSAEYELEADMMPPDPDGPSMFNRLRAGGEARYYFGDGIATVSVNDGPEVPVPRHNWIGFRGGAESFDGFSHLGEFADVTLGWDANLGDTAFGMTLTGGVSIEPSSVFPGNAQNDPTDEGWDGTSTGAALPPTPASYMSPYLALGIHLQF